MKYQLLYLTPEFLLMSRKKSFSFSHFKSVKYETNHSFACDILEKECFVEILYVGSVFNLPGLCFSVFINDELGY